MTKTEDAKMEVTKVIPAPISHDEALSADIRRALEMMKRVQVATGDKSQLGEQQGNRYVLPEPLVFQFSGVN